ncbi:MAG TPA: phosphate acyltransferase PlsX [Candidatus Cloacimonadota bacterium]|nr:phosphate acyltransferase PlsX [Candidatus Cloacimonadota bacterium]HPT71138.1 phosphate acyltransferase PlsX [Candidatus Cloacimonadota bacterium]
MRIALDAFGSDHAPYPEVEGAVLAIKEDVCDKILLVGKKEILEKELSKYYFDAKRIEIVDAEEERIAMDDGAAQTVRSRPNSSLVKTVRLYKDGEADAAVSAGNTGAMMAASLFTYGRIPGVLRPAIAVTFPTLSNYEIILDVGANVDCESENLVQFAILGKIYFQLLYGGDNPRVSLLNIGEESKKGNELVKEAYSKMQTNSHINFIGNIEGKDVMKGITDVIVCDGFVGNVMLKTIEGALISIFAILKEQFKKDWIAKLGALLSYPVYIHLKKKLDHAEYGGALLLGLNGISVISHGRANAIAVKNAVRFGARIAQSGYLEIARAVFEGGAE